LISKYLGNAQWLSIRSIFDPTDSFGCEDRFIEIDNLIVFLPKISKLLLQIKPPLFILLLLLRIDPLDKFDSFTFDFILLVELGK
jgi:hypothetical protein